MTINWHGTEKKDLLSRSRVIVSCTTTSDRLELFFYMLQSVKRQSLRPDKVFLNLSSEPYLWDSGIRELPEWLRGDAEVEVNWVENTGSYRKLLPIINSCSDEDLVVTADDDVLYHKEWLSSLVMRSAEYPDHLVCARARRMKRAVLGGWQNYSRWPLAEKLAKGMEFLPTGSGGIVYRKRLLDLEFLNDRAFNDIAPTNDDLWFRMASIKKNVLVCVDPEINSRSFFIAHPHGLEDINSNGPGKELVGKLIYYSIGSARAWLGIDASRNDAVWTEIAKYSKL